jgi:hypothetical protein
VRAARLAAALRKARHAGPPPGEALQRAQALPRANFSIVERNRLRSYWRNHVSKAAPRNAG